MTRWLCALTLAGSCVACTGSDTTEPVESSADATSAAIPASEQAVSRARAPRFREVTLPAGTTLRLDLMSSVASDTSKVEDPVRAELRQAVSVDGTTVLPVGTELVGTVTDAERSARVKGKARIAYRFHSLRHDDERYEISTAPIAHEAKSQKAKDMTKVGIGAGVGAAVGGLLGGGSGAAKGAAIGGAAGTGAVLATRGEEVRLGPGADVTTRLTEPLTVRVKI